MKKCLIAVFTVALISVSVGSPTIISAESKYSKVNAEEFSYQIKFKNGTTKEFKTKLEALSYFNSIQEESYLMENKEVINFKRGFAKTKSLTNIYAQNSNKILTYVSSDTELGVLAIENSKILVTIGGVKGYVKKSDVALIPYMTNSELSHYVRKGNYLYHSLYRNNTYINFKVGHAPKHLEDGYPVYSFDGVNFEGIETYQYFNYLPLRTPTNYSGEELDKYISAVSPNSPLIGYGQAFVDAAAKNNLNALYLLSNAIHESGWGKSKIAREKNNLFGFKASDSNSFQNAATFETIEEGIYYCAEYISNNYIDSDGNYYNNAILGNKGKGMNVKYASDPFWGEKIAAQMSNIDDFLGNKDNDKFKLTILEKDTPIYIIKNQKPIYLEKLPSERVVAIKDKVSINNTAYFELYSDNSNYGSIFVKANSLDTIKTY